MSLLPADACTEPQRERLAGLLPIRAARIEPTLRLECHRVVKVRRVMYDGPGACVDLNLGHVSQFLV